jgi:hypothetical protein
MIYRHMPLPREPSYRWLLPIPSVIVTIVLLACSNPVVPDHGIVCWDGSVCPSWTSCPPPGYATGHCDANIAPGPGDPNGRYARALDGGLGIDGESRHFRGDQSP